MKKEIQNINKSNHKFRKSYQFWLNTIKSPIKSDNYFKKRNFLIGNHYSSTLIPMSKLQSARNLKVIKRKGSLQQQSSKRRRTIDYRKEIDKIMEDSTTSFNKMISIDKDLNQGLWILIEAKTDLEQ